jgi:DNA polymerase sigma
VNCQSLDCVQTLQPSADLDAARRLVVSEMQQLVAEALPASLHCSVETFGSFRAGLHLPGQPQQGFLVCCCGGVETAPHLCATAA